MSQIEILEEKQIVKLEEMVLLGNPLDHDIEMKFDGRTYLLPSKKILRVRDRVASCLLQDYSQLGLVVVKNAASEALSLSEPIALQNYYNFLMEQLHSWIDWMSDQTKRGKGILGEPLRVKELKVTIADLEDKLNIPRQLGSDVYVEIEEDRKRLLALNKGKRTSAMGEAFLAPQPIASIEQTAKKRGRKAKNAQEPSPTPDLNKKYFSSSSAAVEETPFVNQTAA